MSRSIFGSWGGKASKEPWKGGGEQIQTTSGGTLQAERSKKGKKLKHRLIKHRNVYPEGVSMKKSWKGGVPDKPRIQSRVGESWSNKKRD